MMNTLNIQKHCRKRKMPSMLHHRTGMKGMIKVRGALLILKGMKTRTQPMKNTKMTLIKKMLKKLMVQ
eukprot:12516238-Prorocentrum_lima.AAC.1